MQPQNQHLAWIAVWQTERRTELPHLALYAVKLMPQDMNVFWFYKHIITTHVLAVDSGEDDETDLSQQQHNDDDGILYTDTRMQSPQLLYRAMLTANVNYSIGLIPVL